MCVREFDLADGLPGRFVFWPGELSAGLGAGGGRGRVQFYSLVTRSGSFFGWMYGRRLGDRRKAHLAGRHHRDAGVAVCMSCCAVVRAAGARAAMISVRRCYLCQGLRLHQLLRVMSTWWLAM